MPNLSRGYEFELQAEKRARTFISTTMVVQQDSFCSGGKANTEKPHCDISREDEKN